MPFLYACLHSLCFVLIQALINVALLFGLLPVCIVASIIRQTIITNEQFGVGIVILGVK